MSTTSWTSGFGPNSVAGASGQANTSAASNPAPIAEVHVLLTGLQPGDAEVQIKWPDDAKLGAPNAQSNQAAIIQAAVREVLAAARTLSG